MYIFVFGCMFMLSGPTSKRSRRESVCFEDGAAQARAVLAPGPKCFDGQDGLELIYLSSLCPA